MWRESEALDAIDFNKLKTIYDEEGYGDQIWSGVGVGSVIYVEDALKIMTTSCELYNIIIDCWADMLKGIDDYNELSTFQRRCYFINSLCWSFITLPNLDYARQKEIDKHIPSFGDSKYVVFSMNSNGRKENCSADHWTLLVLNTEEGVWTHYNSLRPRTKASRDMYLEDAIISKKYVKKKITEFNHSKGIDMDTQDKELPIISCQTCPQQKSNSVACGLHVCYIMKKLTKGEEIEERLTARQLTEFRAEIVSLFLNNPNSWNEEDRKVRRELKKKFGDK